MKKSLANKRKANDIHRKHTPETKAKLASYFGSKNSQWKGGCSGTIRMNALKRDDYTCKNCGLRDPEIMEVDHIESKTFYPEISNKIENLVTLCPNCHKKKTVRDSDLKNVVTKQGIHIFLDGPDGCSKTTICELLSKKTGFLVSKMQNAKDVFNSGSIESYSYLYNRTIAQMYRFNFIVDRGFTSSLVYSKVYKRNENLSYIAGVEKMLKPLVIILTATNDELMKRRPVDEVIKQEFRKTIRDEYENLAILRGYPLIDTTGKTKEQVLRSVLDLINEKYGTEY